MTWCPQSPQIPIDQLRTIQLLRVNKTSTKETEMLKIDLSHCQHLENVSLADMKNVRVLLNHSNLTDMKLQAINTSDIHVMKLATRVDFHVKQVKMIHMCNLEFCKLFLSAVVWEIDNLNIIECRESIIKIDLWQIDILSTQ